MLSEEQITMMTRLFAAWQIKARNEGDTLSAMMNNNARMLLRMVLGEPTDTEAEEGFRKSLEAALTLYGPDLKRDEVSELFKRARQHRNN